MLFRLVNSSSKYFNSVYFLSSNFFILGPNADKTLDLNIYDEPEK